MNCTNSNENLTTPYVTHGGREMKPPLRYT